MFKIAFSMLKMSFSILKTTLMEQMKSMCGYGCHFVQKKEELKLRRIEVEQAANDRYWKDYPFATDDDDERKSFSEKEDVPNENLNFALNTLFDLDEEFTSTKVDQIDDEVVCFAVLVRLSVWKGDILFLESLLFDKLFSPSSDVMISDSEDDVKFYFPFPCSNLFIVDYYPIRGFNIDVGGMTSPVDVPNIFPSHPDLSYGFRLLPSMISDPIMMILLLPKIETRFTIGGYALKSNTRKILVLFPP
ncbi:hypothetical protein Tco_0904632 [Tanacetum coccineum]